MEVNITFRHIYEDFRKAQIIYLFRLRKRYIVLAPIILLVLVGVILQWIFEGFSEYMLTILILYGISTFVIIYRAFVLPITLFKKNSRAQYDYNYIFKDEGVEIISKEVTSKYKWEFFNKVIETKDFFLLFFKKNTFLIIPKRAFEDDGDIVKLKTILNNVGISVKSI